MKLTIVMYHYVRKLSESDYPNINALEFELFVRQLDYLQENYSIISLLQLLDYVRHNKALPVNPCLLTFDDGYKDHFQYVFPELYRRGLSGVFFPVVKTVTDRFMLDVNRIHYILASIADTHQLVKTIDQLCLESGIQQADISRLHQQYEHANRLNTAETFYIKNLLQHALPKGIRSEIADELFMRFVSRDSKGFANQLYLSESDILKMLDAGMSFGIHGYQHIRLDTSPIAMQTEEISRSIEFLDELGQGSESSVICYPYGEYDNQTIDIAKGLGCVLGFTTQPHVADLSSNPLILPRLDTIDISALM